MSIAAAAHFVAQAELALESAREVEAHATTAAEAITERIAASERRRQKIRADLDAEKIGEAEAGGLYAMADADLLDLADLHRAAHEKLGKAIEQTRAAVAEHGRAVAALAGTEATEKFAAMTAYAAKLDAALCDAVAELASLARQTGRAGNSLSSAFMPSQRLTSMIQFRQIPKAAA